MEPPDTITCVDCGGICHLVAVIEDDGHGEGNIGTYRCELCLDRWDVIFDDPIEDDPYAP